MKGTEVPNPRRSSACDYTCVLTKNRSRSCDSLILASTFCFVSAYAKFAHKFQTLFERLVQLIFSFPSWFHSIWFYCSHAFHSFLLQITLCFSFGLKDMITAFTCLLSYRYSTFTLRTYLCWRHTVLLPMSHNRTHKGINRTWRIKRAMMSASHTTATGHSHLPCDVSRDPNIDMLYVPGDSF